MKKFAILFQILLLSFLIQPSYAKDQCCQFYNLIIQDIRQEFKNSNIDSLPPGQKIDPLNPESTKTYPIKKDIYLDMYVSPDLFILSTRAFDGRYGGMFKFNKSVKVSRIGEANLRMCIDDPLIISRFEISKTLYRFNESYYRTEILNNKTIIRNPFKIIFSNILYLNNEKAIVFAETHIGISPNNRTYGYIFKMKNGEWQIERRVISSN